MADRYISMMTPEDRKDFNFNVHHVNHVELISKFSYGIRRYILKEDCLNPFGEYK
jgi:hypothetical protein